ncbi:MAG: polyprenyl synthetase family protein [Acidimicrobiales bacterium]
MSSADWDRAQEAIAAANQVVRPTLEAAVGRLEPQLGEPALFHLAGGGKGVRGALTVVACQASGGTPNDAVLGAVAVELVHNYSLIHDDIIDKDTERRHRPTVWWRFGLGRAIVVGDALAALSLQVLLEDPRPQRVRGAQALAEATSQMIEGQAADMAFESERSVSVEDCLRMEEAKTAALMACACGMGGILATADDATIKALFSFGKHLGVSFQAIDDVLGIWGDPEKTGKPVGSDLLAHKQSLPVVVALSMGDGDLQARLQGNVTEADVAELAARIESTGARAEVTQISERALAEALGALESAHLVGEHQERLAAIARFVIERDR